MLPHLTQTPNARHNYIDADQRYSIPGKDQFRYIKIHLRLRGLGLNKVKEIISRLILLFPRASEPSMNFNVSLMVYYLRRIFWLVLFKYAVFWKLKTI